LRDAVQGEETVLTRCIQLLVFALLIMPLTSPADDWAVGIPEGTPFPNVNAVDQSGQTWSNKELIGENGLVLFFVRSSDW
tara:strand:+ start:518 stop:757 length:240 start_codon:yes stop_codon:yes gene_type:complete